MDYLLMVLYGSLAIGFSFFCSVAEAVLLSVTPSYVITLAERRPKVAQRLTRLREHVDRPLAAILSLNTIAHTIGAAGVGAQVAVIWGNTMVAAASAIMTLLILVLSEIIPKTLGANYWRQLAGSVSTAIEWLMIPMFPFVFLSEKLTKMLAGKGHGQLITREEIAAMAHLGATKGLLHKSESRILTNLMRLQNLTASDVMTPRVVVVAFPEQQTILETISMDNPLPVSRLPVYEEHIDQPTGFVLKHDLLLALANAQGEQKLTDFKRTLPMVAGDMPLPELMNSLLQHRSHIVGVNDRFGGLQGIVTLEDVVETLLGIEIVDEHDADIDMQKLARDRWQERAQALGLDTLPNEAASKASLLNNEER